MSDLKDFVIEDGVLKKYVGTGGDVVVPDEVKKMYKNIFYKNANITSVIFPNSLIEIGSEACVGCENLTKVTIPNGVKEIRVDAFKDCSALECIVLPESLEVIGDCAFEGCSNLKSIIIPQNVKIIGRNAFKGCSNIKSVSLPDGIVTIKPGAFFGCDNLADNNDFIIIKGILQDCLKKTENLIIPDTVKVIAVFIGHKNLKALTIPTGVTTIVTGALHNSFWGNGCENLQEIILKGEITSFEDSCLKDLCSELYDTKSKLILLHTLLKYVPKAVLEHKNINRKIKANKKALVEFLIEKEDAETVEKLFALFKKIELDELNEFVEKADNCASVKAFLLNYKEQHYPIKTQEKIENVKIEKELGLKELSVTDWKKIFAFESDAKGVTIKGYKGEDSDVIIPEKIGGKNVIKIGEEAFSPNKDRISKQIQETRRKIVSIHIPNTVKSIGSKAFYDCENLKSIKLSSKISSIGYGAFLGCVELSNIELPETIKTIGGEGFCGCKSLRKIQLPSKISKLDYATFNSCTKLEIIELPQTIKQIREWNFYNCPNLTIHAPAGSYAESYAKENNIPFVAE